MAYFCHLIVVVGDFDKTPRVKLVTTTDFEIFRADFNHLKFRYLGVQYFGTLCFTVPIVIEPQNWCW